MIGPLLQRVCARHGRTAALLCASKLARLAIGSDCPTVSLDTLEGRLLRRNPADPMEVALRACNATTSREFIAAMALLALTKAAVQEGDDEAGSALWVAGLLLELGAKEEVRQGCFVLLARLLEPGVGPTDVERAIRDFNDEVASSGHG